MAKGRHEPPRVAILVNILAPYRVPIYQSIAAAYETKILYSGEEENRSTWHGVADRLRGITLCRSWGFTFRVPYRRQGEVFDHRRVHLTPGLLWDLFSFRPDAVITIEMGFRTLVALLYGSVMRRSVWVWWGGTTHTERGLGLMRKAVRKLIVRWAKRWISYGETSTEYLLTLGVERNAILQIQNCVDEQSFATEVAPAQLFRPGPVLLCVGQLIRRKGVDLLLRAAAELQHRGFQFSLVLVGDGPEKDALMALAQDLKLRDLYVLPGQRPEAMPAVYRSADMLVFPTLEDVWGLVVNEAAWSGLPVLCSVYAGCARELCSSEAVFDPLNHDQFVATLKNALDGHIKPIDRACLLSSHQVSQMIVQDIRAVMRGRGESDQNPSLSQSVPDSRR